MVECLASEKRDPSKVLFLSRKDVKMAVCAHCGKKTTFGNNRSFSMKATKRKFKPNLQKVTLYENGKKVKKVLCTKCIKTLAKTA